MVASPSSASSGSAPLSDQADRTDRVSFDIPEQPLATALDAFSRESGVQVLYESGLALGVRSLGVTGAFAPGVALNALIAGTDLVARFVGPKAVTLTRPSAASASEPPVRSFESGDLVLQTLLVTADDMDEERLRAYAAILRADIEQALKRDDKTRSGPYVAGLRLWVDPSRIVHRMEFVQSSGNSTRDAAISGVLRGLSVSEAPPPWMPNPVAVKISVRGL